MHRKFKLIGFDVDGTILTNDHKVCNRLIRVVNKLKEQNYIFTLVTARYPVSALKIAQELGLAHNESIITLNGSYITNNLRESIYSKTFAINKLSTLLNKLSLDITINYYSGFTWKVNQYTKFTDRELLFCKEIVYPELGVIDEVNKITLNGETKDLIIAKDILSQDESLIIAFSHPNYLEVATKDISKWHGLEHYANTLNIKTEEIIAFGDGENDIPMLQGAGLGVAMDNANERVKQSATDIAGHHNEYGVAIYLETLIKNGVL